MLLFTRVRVSNLHEWSLNFEMIGIHKKYFNTSAMLWSKVGKRRKDDRIRNNPHMEALLNQSKKKTAKNLCLDHFDIFYRKTFGKQWPSLRLAMLSRPKFCALVNNFGDSDTTIKRLHRMGCYSIAKKYEEELISCKEYFENTQTSAVQRQIQASNSEIELPIQNIVPEQASSMTPEMASKRIIQPQEMIFQGAGSEIDAASASMYDFVPSTKIKGMEDFVEESDYYSVHEVFTDERSKKGSLPIEIRQHKRIEFPKYLNVFTFASGATDMRLEPPEKGSLGTFDYYCMDAGSLLPVLALDIQKGNSVLDTCAAPGGKSLAILQTMMSGRLVANDRDGLRVKRLLDVMSAYLHSYDRNYADEFVEFKRSNAEALPYHMGNTFDRVLCDVPCTTDRASLHQDDGNLFNVTRKAIRLKIPAQQSGILQSAMKCVKQGGSVVYSTCTLSPIQNDGVVYDALKSVYADTGLEFIVEDLSVAMDPFRTIMKISDKTKGTAPYYGQLVLPTMENNFGPMYLAKLTRK